MVADFKQPAPRDGVKRCRGASDEENDVGTQPNVHSSDEPPAARLRYTVKADIADVTADSPPVRATQSAAEVAEQVRSVALKWGPAPRLSGAGQVKKIELWNFSCHTHFVIEFNNNVTIVHGANGSGKTSIIDALQICLGAKGSDTSRATKLSGMIKHKCAEAIAKVCFLKDYYASPSQIGV